MHTLRSSLLGALAVVAGVLVVEVLAWPALWAAALALGPLATGLVLVAVRRDWRAGAGAWAIAGLFALAVDWVLNGEDQAFHLALAVVTAALVALGAALAAGVRRVAR